MNLFHCFSLNLLNNLLSLIIKWSIIIRNLFNISLYIRLIRLFQIPIRFKIINCWFFIYIIFRCSLTLIVEYLSLCSLPWLSSRHCIIIMSTYGPECCSSIVMRITKMAQIYIWYFSLVLPIILQHIQYPFFCD